MRLIGVRLPGGEILRTAGLSQVYSTGNGTIVLRGTVSVEEEKSRPSQSRKHGRNAIVITELPYMTNKARVPRQCRCLCNLVC